MAYCIISSSLGIHIFLDTGLVILKKDTNKSEFTQSMKLLSSFSYKDTQNAAEIIHAFEHQNQLPELIIEWFDTCMSSLPPKSRNAKWFSTSQKLGELLTEHYEFSCTCLTPTNQRLVNESLCELLDVDSALVDQMSAELAKELYREKYLDE